MNWEKKRSILLSTDLSDDSAIKGRSFHLLQINYFQAFPSF